jgi:hypothetical protein
MALQSIACGYYGIAGGLLAGFAVLWFSRFDGRWRQVRYWVLGLAAAGLAFILVAPFYAPYLTIQNEGFGRTLDDARVHSVAWRSYLASPRPVDQWLLDLLPFWREVLFPGLMPIGFALFVAVRRLWPGALPAPGGRGVLGFYGAVGVLGWWVSLGPDGGLYTVLYHTLPGFDLIRAPARFGLLVTLMMALVGGAGVAIVERSLRGRARTAVVGALLALVAARASVGGLALVDAGPVSRAYSRLAVMPDAPVVAFPYWTGGNRHRHTEYMVLSTAHWKPLVNGYSDHFPPDIQADKDKLASFPEAVAWEPLRVRKVRYVLMHWNLYPPDERGARQRDMRRLVNYLRLVVEDADVSLYEVISWPESRLVAEPSGG